MPKKGFSSQHAQALSFLLAGYETSANLLSFTVYCLAQDPARERKLREELNSVRGACI